MDHHPPDKRETDPWIRGLGLKPFKPRRLDAPIPRLVGDLLGPPTGPEPTRVRLGRLVLVLKPSDYKVLEVVAHHPFLSPDRLAVVLRWETRRVRERIAGLRRHGLIRQLDPSETGAVKAEDLWELTADGLRLVAARMGLPLPVAVRANGIVGGGPEKEIGRRRNLIRYLAHTVGADGVFIDLFRLADLFGEQGGDDELIEWQGPAACARGSMRPDGYGEYRRAGKVHPFYLEYDRGTTSRRDYFEKFTSYYRYVERRRFEWDYHGCPIILFVTTSLAAEKRIAESLRTVSGGYPFELDALLTCEGLGVVSRYNPEGLLGPIWRDAWTTDRRHWLAPLSSAQPQR
jgi:hypothetical protein